MWPFKKSKDDEKKEKKNSINHFTTIGLPIHIGKDLEKFAQRTYDKNKVMIVKQGKYFIFTDKSGAQLYLQLNKNDQFIGANPHFSGNTTRRVGLSRRIDGKYLDGEIYAWAEPVNPKEPDSGLYPFVFDVPDYYLLPDIKFPSMATIQLAAFSENISIFEDEKSFSNQEGNSQLASNFFIPSGLFAPNGKNMNPPQSHALFAAKIISVEKLLNHATGIEFIHLCADTYGGDIDIVIDVKKLKHLPVPGNVIQGSFWLSGKVIKYNQ